MILAFDEFELDTERLELRRAGKPVKAEALVVRLLLVLLQNADRLLTKDELVEQVWSGRAVADNVITVSMARLRKTLGYTRGDREFVVTVYGRGYRFVRDVVARSGSAGPSPTTVQASTADLPFVGRDHVLGRLREALSEARLGRGRTCALMGEAGIGKTRTIEMLEREISGSQVHMAWGYCRESGDTPPLWPWLRLLREVIATTWSADLERRLGPLASDLHALLREPGAAEPSTRESADLAPGAADALRYRSFEAVLRALALAAEHTPWVLVLDDLHRADSASIELASLLLDEIAHTRILVIATLRHSQGRRAPRPDTLLPQVLGHRNCERIALDRLAAADVASYVAALVDDANGELGRAVYAKSEGNPFFMTELSRQLRDAEHPHSDALAVSDTALELIRQRVARLDADTRAVLSAAAVIGRSFELWLLCAIMEREPGALIGCLDEALAEEVVVAAPDSMTAFAFGHELLRAVLYDALPPREQRRWHLLVAQALELRMTTAGGIAPAELAYHFHAALPESDLRKTVTYCRRAAAAAGAVFANSDVVRYARHALEALDLMDTPSVRLRATLLYMTALYERGHAVEFPRAISKVMEIAREQGDGPLLIGAACMLNPHAGWKPIPGSGRALEHALGLLRPDDLANRAIALAALACAAPQCFAIERCQPLSEEAIALARKSGSRTALRVALVYGLYLQGGPAHEEAAAAIREEVEQLAQQQPRTAPVLPAELALRRAIAALQRGDNGIVTTSLEQAATRSREVRHGELLWHAERFSALWRINAGSLTDGVALLETLHRRAEQRPIIGTEPFCAFDRLVIFGELSQGAALDDRARSALEYDASDPPSIWSLKVRALASADLAGEARAALRAIAPGDLARLPCDADYLGTLGHIARAALLLGALDYAEAVYPLLAPYPDRFAGHVSFLCEGSVSQLLGMLSRALGQRTSASDQLELGVQMNERAGFIPRAIEARLELAESLLGRSSPQHQHQRQRALALAREAHASAARLGMQRLARDASTLLQREDKP